MQMAVVYGTCWQQRYQELKFDSTAVDSSYLMTGTFVVHDGQRDYYAPVVCIACLRAEKGVSVTVRLHLHSSAVNSNCAHCRNIYYLFI